MNVFTLQQQRSTCQMLEKVNWNDFAKVLFSKKMSDEY